MSRFRRDIERLEPYAPGEQPAVGTTAIKLNTNENAFPPSPHVRDALRVLDIDQLRRYPRPFADEFRVAAAEVLNVDTSWILPGNGSDDLLTQLFRAVTDPNRGVTYPTPTYVLYRTLANIQGCPVTEVTYDDAYTLPTTQLTDASAALTIIANPNSPSGTAVSLDELRILADGVKGILAIDEAYVEFSNGSALDLAREYDHVIVLRTLSKSHGLAGLRLGFAIAQPSLLEGLTKVKDSYNVDAIAAHLGAVAIRDIDYTRKVTDRIVAARSHLVERLEALDFYVWPSQANFLLVRPTHCTAKTLYETLRSQNLFVRYFDEPRLANTLRITIGTDEDNQALIDTLKALHR
ncbi:histidinol-phosphate transaminase [bacterium]|nr:MAG: histidinol-phosphate transaminase [bacterium]